MTIEDLEKLCQAMRKLKENRDFVTSDWDKMSDKEQERSCGDRDILIDDMLDLFD